jgi:hypothetical protein
MSVKEAGRDKRTRTKSRPRSSGLSVSIFFFLAFMMLGWGCQRREYPLESTGAREVV